MARTAVVVFIQDPGFKRLADRAIKFSVNKTGEMDWVFLVRNLNSYES